MSDKPSKQFENGLERLLNESKARREADKERYDAQDWDLCVLCHAYGADKRSLFIDCWYAVSEAVDEAIDVYACNVDGHKTGWFLRICKSCRGRFLGMLREWAQVCRSRRTVLKDHDGADDWDDEGARNIPVRIHGATVMMTREEYDEYESARASLRSGGRE